MSIWRVGGKIPLNVYEDERPMFQCHTPEDAARVVGLLNLTKELAEALEKCLELRQYYYYLSENAKAVLAKFHEQEGK